MPYTYLIGWSKQNKYYYGARWAKNCSPDDLWKKYFTSSKHVKSLVKSFGNPDIIQVRKIFNDVEQCRLHEQRMLIKLKVLTDDRWINKNINGRFLPYGKQTEEHVRSRVQSYIENGKGKGRVAWTAKTHPEYAKKVSDGLKGKKKSEQHKQKIKLRPQNTLTLTCPHCNKTGDLKNIKRWHMDNCTQSHKAE